MVMFKTLDIRGLSFFNAFQETSKAFSDIDDGHRMIRLFIKKVKPHTKK